MKQVLLLTLLLCGSASALTNDVSEITPENVTATMNAHRAAAGLPPLVLNEKLTRAAESRMQDMIEGQWWDHASPEGTSPFVWLAAADYDYLYAAENLAAGFDTTPVLLEAWLESPGHRANVMGARYSDCGVAIIEGTTRGKALGRSVVVLFGRQKTPLFSAK